MRNRRARTDSPVIQPATAKDVEEVDLKEVSSTEPDTLLDDDGNRIKVLTCGHAFHEACIANWEESSALCPVCRVPQEQAAREPGETVREPAATNPEDLQLATTNREHRLANDYAFRLNRLRFYYPGKILNC